MVLMTIASLWQHLCECPCQRCSSIQFTCSFFTVFFLKKNSPRDLSCKMFGNESAFKDGFSWLVVACFKIIYISPSPLQLTVLRAQTVNLILHYWNVLLMSNMAHRRQLLPWKANRHKASKYFDLAKYLGNPICISQGLIFIIVANKHQPFLHPH